MNRSPISNSLFLPEAGNGLRPAAVRNRGTTIYHVLTMEQICWGGNVFAGKVAAFWSNPPLISSCVKCLSGTKIIKGYPF